VIAWPWEQLQANNEIMIKTIENILKENEFSGGILRYKCDRYNGQAKLADLSLGGGGV
jgi:GH15 family glucan-1,4-alpha-glucosidase